MQKKLCVITLVIVLVIAILSGCAQKADKTQPDAEGVLTHGALKCSLTVSCAQILDNMSSISEEKKDLVPKDGIIYSSKEVEFSEGETAFDILDREMKENKIHFDFDDMPMYDSVYIKGIGNIYEFDCGEFSGWTYLVDGNSPMVALSQYNIEDGDRIELVYSCNLMEQ